MKRASLLLMLIAVCAATAFADDEMLKSTGPAKPPQKIQAVTPKEADEAIFAYKQWAKEVEKKVAVTFVTIETKHFLIFTDWDPREHEFLKRNIEDAYTAVSRQFELSPSDNVFVGKLPVFMYAKQTDFVRFANEVDEFKVPENVAGYYHQSTSGFGHLVMWKPDVAKAKGNVHLAEMVWAYTLTHEFTHAFVARYRTNALVPRWLNEGLAEVVASRQFPIYRVYSIAKDQASKRKSIQSLLLEEHGLLKSEEYPVAQTVVETMLKENPKNFLKFFNDIKDGMKLAEALNQEFKTTPEGLESAWRKYLPTTKDPR
jgi:hypothetical protein